MSRQSDCCRRTCSMPGEYMQEKERKRKRKEHSKSSSKKHKHKKVRNVDCFCFASSYGQVSHAYLVHFAIVSTDVMTCTLLLLIML